MHSIKYSIARYTLIILLWSGWLVAGCVTWITISWKPAWSPHFWGPPNFFKVWTLLQASALTKKNTLLSVSQISATCCTRVVWQVSNCCSKTLSISVARSPWNPHEILLRPGHPLRKCRCACTAWCFRCAAASSSPEQMPQRWQGSLVLQQKSLWNDLKVTGKSMVMFWNMMSIQEMITFWI